MGLVQIAKLNRFTAPSILVRGAETYATGTPTTYDLFTITGNILLFGLSARVAVVMEAGAKTIAVQANAVAMDNAGYDLAANGAGTRIIVHGAGVIETIVSALAASSVSTATLPWVVCPGTIDFILTGAGAIGTVAGALEWQIEWQPLTQDANVTLA